VFFLWYTDAVVLNDNNSTHVSECTSEEAAVNTSDVIRDMRTTVLQLKAEHMNDDG
jgi:hypothetical protein